MRYFGFSDAAGAWLFAGVVPFSGSAFTLLRKKEPSRQRRSFVFMV